MATVQYCTAGSGNRPNEDTRASPTVDSVRSKSPPDLTGRKLKPEQHGETNLAGRIWRRMWIWIRYDAKSKVFWMIEGIPEAVTSEYGECVCKAFLVRVPPKTIIVSETCTSAPSLLAVETSDKDSPPPHRLRLSHQLRASPDWSLNSGSSLPMG